MKEFYQQMGKYFARYKGYIISTFGMNVLAAIFNVFSFSILIPILQILFKVNTEQYELLPWSSAGSIDEFVDVAKNNGYYYSQMLVDTQGPSTTLLILGLVLAFLTLLKTAA